MWMKVMTDLQRTLAEAAGEAAPSWTGRLADEMFVGGGGNSVVQAIGNGQVIATVEPGDPYGPQQDSGYHGGPANPDGGKYYSLREWVMGKLGGDEGDVFRIAQSLDYSGNAYLEITEAMSGPVIDETGVKASDYIYTGLGFAE
jgi:hypothetical protein